MTHTPGPWRINTKGTIGNQVEADSGERLYESDDGYRGVALFMSCCSSRNYAEEEANRLANARLIAAAPILLEAVIAAEDYFATLPADDAAHPLYLQMNAAIAAARQESAS